MIAILAFSDIYLDTSVVAAAISSGDPHSVACTTFCGRLARDNVRVYFSQLLRLEIAQFIRKLATDPRSVVSPSLYQQYQLRDFGTDSGIRQQWMQFGMAQFDALLGTFYRVFELPLRKQIWQQSIDLMSLYGLESYDAAHVATAFRAGLSDLATVDGKFARVSGLHVHTIR